MRLGKRLHMQPGQGRNIRLARLPKVKLHV
jgi:hypothetical protein